jgi:hypothetical protein
MIVGVKQYRCAYPGAGRSRASAEAFRVVSELLGTARRVSDTKFHPVTPVAAATNTACSRSESGIGEWRDLKASGPAGISIPKAKRRARRPKIACIKGNCSSSRIGLIVSVRLVI